MKAKVILKDCAHTAFDKVVAAFIDGPGVDDAIEAFMKERGYDVHSFDSDTWVPVSCIDKPWELCADSAMYVCTITVSNVPALA